MTTKQQDKPTVQATLCEIERGLYYITYRSGRRKALPVYQVGSCAADARRRLETILAATGSLTVEWVDPFMDPPPHSIERRSVDPAASSTHPSEAPRQLIHS